MNFRKRDLKVEVVAKDLGQKKEMPSFSGTSDKTTVNHQHPFVCRSGIFFAGCWG